MEVYVNVVGLVIFILVMVAGVVIVIISKQQHKKRLLQVQQVATQYGWTYEPIKDKNTTGYRISRGDWELEGTLTTTTSSSGNSNHSISTNRLTCWWTKAVSIPEGIILIGPRQETVNIGGISDFVMQASLQIMIGNDAEYTQGIKEMPVERPDLAAKIMVWTNREERARRLLSMEVENILLSIPKNLPVIVKFTPLCLEVKVMSQCVEQPNDLLTIVKLGDALIRAAA